MYTSKFSEAFTLRRIVPFLDLADATARNFQSSPVGGNTESQGILVESRESYQGG